MANNHLNNIFNKKNVEYALDDERSDLPYQSKNDVSLKSNQIIFTAINYSLQKLLDNDLYNEALLKKFINEGSLVGPRYVYDPEIVLGSATNKKFVLSDENGISVVHKREVPIEQTLEGPYLSTQSINEIDFIEDVGFEVGATSGIWHSKNRRKWDASNISSNVIEICFNENYLNQKDSVFSKYEFLAIGSNGALFGIQLSDVEENKWKDFSSDRELSTLCYFDGYKPLKLYSAKNDKLYVGTTNGVYSLYGRVGEYPHKELFSRGWQVNDFIEIEDATSSYGRYLLGTNEGIKQSHKLMLFANLENNGSVSQGDVTSIELVGNSIFVSATNGLYKTARGKRMMLPIDVYDENGEKTSLGLIASMAHVSYFLYAVSGNVLYKIDVRNNSNASIVRRVLLPDSAKEIMAFNGMLVVRTDNDVYYADVSNIDAWTSVSSKIYGWDSSSVKVNGLQTSSNSLYVVASNGVYKLDIYGADASFKYVDTFFKNKKTKFVKTLADGRVAISDGSELYVFSSLDFNSSPNSQSLTCGVDKSATILDVDADNSNDNSNIYVLYEDGRVYKYSEGGDELLMSANGANSIGLYANYLMIGGATGLSARNSVGGFFEVQDGISVGQIAKQYYSYSLEDNYYIGKLTTLDSFELKIASNTSFQSDYLEKAFNESGSKTNVVQVDYDLSNSVLSAPWSIVSQSQQGIGVFSANGASFDGVDYIGYARERDTNASFLLMKNDISIDVKFLSNDGFHRLSSLTGFNGQNMKTADAYSFDNYRNLSVAANFIVCGGKAYVKKTSLAAVREDASVYSGFNSAMSGDGVFLIGSDSGLLRYSPSTLGRLELISAYSDKTIVSKADCSSYYLISKKRLIDFDQSEEDPNKLAWQIAKTDSLSDSMSSLESLYGALSATILISSGVSSFAVLKDVMAYAIDVDEPFSDKTYYQEISSIDFTQVSSIYLSSDKIIAESELSTYVLSIDAANEALGLEATEPPYSTPLSDVVNGHLQWQASQVSSCLSVKYAPFVSGEDEWQIVSKTDDYADQNIIELSVDNNNSPLMSTLISIDCSAVIDRYRKEYDIKNLSAYESFNLDWHATLFGNISVITNFPEGDSLSLSVEIIATMIEAEEDSDSNTTIVSTLVYSGSATKAFDIGDSFECDIERGSKLSLSARFKCSNNVSAGSPISVSIDESNLIAETYIEFPYKSWFLEETNDGENYRIVDGVYGYYAYIDSLGKWVGLDANGLFFFSNFLAEPRSQDMLFALCEDNKLYYVKENDYSLYELLSSEPIVGLVCTKDSLHVAIKDGSDLTFYNSGSASNSACGFFDLIKTDSIEGVDFKKFAIWQNEDSMSAYATIEKNGQVSVVNVSGADIANVPEYSGCLPYGVFSQDGTFYCLRDGELSSSGETGFKDLKSVLATEGISANVLGAYFDSADVRQCVYVTEDQLYYGIQCYNFDSGYVTINSVQNAVDIAVLDFESKKIALVATTQSILSAKIDFNEDFAIDSTNEVVNTGFSNIRAITAIKNGSSYDIVVLDGSDLVSYNNIGEDLNFGSPIRTESAVSDNSSNNADFYGKLLVLGSSLYEIDYSGSTLTALDLGQLNNEAQNLYPWKGSIYAITFKELYRCSNDSVSIEEGLSGDSGVSFKRSAIADSLFADSTPRIVGTNGNEVCYVKSDGDLSSFNCGNRNEVAGVFKSNGTLYAATQKGLYTLQASNYDLTCTHIFCSGENCYAFSPTDGLSYVAACLSGDIMSIKTNDEDLSSLTDEIEAAFSDNDVNRIDKMFSSKYLVFSSIDNVIAYEFNSKQLLRPAFDQLAYACDFKADYLKSIKQSNYSVALISYGNYVETFYDFGPGIGFGNVSRECAILGSSFRSDVYAISYSPISKYLVGSKYGARYAYGNKMTRSFIDRKDRSDSILSKVSAIEKVSNDKDHIGYVVAQGNKLFKITDAKNGAYSKLLSLPEDVVINCLYAVQDNEYLIGTNHGLYLTFLKYDIYDDLRNVTFKSSIGIVDSKLKDIIREHISYEHREDSLVTKVNHKMSNRLPMVSIDGLGVDMLDSNIANGLRHVEGDIVESIETNDEGDSTGHVKIAVRNVATNSSRLQATNLFGDVGFVSEFVDPTSGKTFNIANPSYICKNWASGLKEIYVYVSSTATYYLGNPYGMSNSQFSYNAQPRENLAGLDVYNSLDAACTTLRVYLYNSHFKIKTILAAQCVGNSLPLKIYKDNVYADDSWKDSFSALPQPSILRSLPIANGADPNNTTNLIDASDRLVLDFSVYGTDAQAIRIIAES